jgi:hypothetical protein
MEPDDAALMPRNDSKFVVVFPSRVIETSTPGCAGRPSSGSDRFPDIEVAQTKSGAVPLAAQLGCAEVLNSAGNSDCTSWYCAGSSSPSSRQI